MSSGYNPLITWEDLTIYLNTKILQSKYLSSKIYIQNMVADTLSSIFLCTGPSNWHTLSENSCLGMYQSPINIDREMTIYNPDINNFIFWYDPPAPNAEFYVFNNGHTGRFKHLFLIFMNLIPVNKTIASQSELQK